MFGLGKKKNNNQAPGTPPLTPEQKQTTQAHLPIAEISKGIVIMKDGTLRMILMCSTVNFELKSEDEQNAIIYAYQNFLNGLEFPVQIVMQSRRMDLSKYLEKLQDQIPKAPNQLLQLQIQNYITFINKLLVEANIMDKRFYIIIPYFPPQVRKPNFVAQIQTAISGNQPLVSLPDFEKYAKELKERAAIIAGGLSGIGIRAIQLNTQEIVELMYATFNPELATTEKLTSFENISAPIIEAKQQGQIKGGKGGQPPI